MTEEELKIVLETMDIPTRRRELTKANIRWLLRNLAINNKNHLKLEDVFKELKKLTTQR